MQALPAHITETYPPGCAKQCPRCSAWLPDTRDRWFLHLERCAPDLITVHHVGEVALYGFPIPNVNTEPVAVRVEKIINAPSLTDLKENLR